MVRRATGLVADNDVEGAAWRLVELAVIDAVIRPADEENRLLAARYLLALGDDLPRTLDSLIFDRSSGKRWKFGALLAERYDKSIIHEDGRWKKSAAVDLDGSARHRQVLAGTTSKQGITPGNWSKRATRIKDIVPVLLARMTELLADASVLESLILFARESNRPAGRDLPIKPPEGPPVGEVEGPEDEPDLGRDEPEQSSGETEPEGDVRDKVHHSSLSAFLLGRYAKRRGQLARALPLVVMAIMAFLFARTPFPGDRNDQNEAGADRHQSFPVEAALAGRNLTTGADGDYFNVGVGEVAEYTLSLRNTGMTPVRGGHLSVRIDRRDDYVSPGWYGESPFEIGVDLADSRDWIDGNPAKLVQQVLPLSEEVAYPYGDRCFENSKPEIVSISEETAEIPGRDSGTIPVSDLPDPLVAKDALSQVGFGLSDWNKDLRIVKIRVAVRSGVEATPSTLAKGGDVLTVRNARGETGPVVSARAGEQLLVTTELADSSCSARTDGMNPLLRLSVTGDTKTGSSRLSAQITGQAGGRVGKPIEIDEAFINYADGRRHRLVVVPGSTEFLGLKQGDCKTPTKLDRLPDGILQAGITVGPIFGYVPRDQCDGDSSVRWVRFRVRVE